MSLDYLIRYCSLCLLMIVCIDFGRPANMLRQLLIYNLCTIVAVVTQKINILC